MSAGAAETAEKDQRVEVQSLQSSPAELQRVDQVQCSQSSAAEQVDRQAEKHQQLDAAQHCR